MEIIQIIMEYLNMIKSKISYTI